MASSDGRVIRILGMTLPALPGLLVRLAGTFLRFKRQASRAGSIFERELHRQGLDPETASRLTRAYMEGGSIRQYIQAWR
ncbi:MAG: hypothetical protein ACP5FL_09235 [Thermoplasmatota archaeon]